MKKILIVGLIVGLGAFLVSGCSSTATSSKLITNTSAASNAATAASLTQMVNKSMAAWTSAGSVGDDVDVVTTSGVKSAGVESFTTVTGPVDGYYHVTDEVTTASGTYEVDLNVRLVEDGDGNVSDTYINGTIALSLTVGSSTVTYTMTFGDGTDDYHGTATWSGSTLSSIGASGPLSLSIVSGAITTNLAMSLSSFTLPVTAGADYPTGTMTITLTYDGTTDTTTYTIVFNGTSLAVVSYGSYSTTITIPSS